METQFVQSEEFQSAQDDQSLVKHILSVEIQERADLPERNQQVLLEDCKESSKKKNYFL